jgi:hypothetical protein
MVKCQQASSQLTTHNLVQSHGSEQQKHTTINNDHGQTLVTAALTDGFMRNQTSAESLSITQLESASCTQGIQN